MLARVQAFYGARPLHLLVLLGCFAVAGYAALKVAADPSLPTMLIWFGACVVGHDLVLFPLYALADRSLAAPVRRRSVRAERAVPVLNYVRVPAMASGLLFLLYFPGILHLGVGTRVAATGQADAPFAERWLVLTATLFLTSALLFAVRLARARVRTVGAPANSAQATPAQSPPGRTAESGAPARPRGSDDLR